MLSHMRYDYAHSSIFLTNESVADFYFQRVVAIGGRTCAYTCIKLCKVTDILRDGEIIFRNFTFFMENRAKLKGIVTLSR